MNPKTKRWSVLFGGRLLDELSCNAAMSLGDVRQQLLAQGYDERIEVREFSGQQFLKLPEAWAQRLRTKHVAQRRLA